VDAFQDADGGTQLAQLSIWEWDGANAKPFLVETYQYAADYGGFRFDGQTVRIKTKEYLANFSSCGMCPEPRGMWTIRTTPTGVQDQGHKIFPPELKRADELLSRIEEGEEAPDIAAPRVVAALEAQMHEPEAADGVHPPKKEFSWGMLERCSVQRNGRRGIIEIAMDECRLRFTYVLRRQRYYFTGLRIK
jgi:hypothetical protein